MDPIREVARTFRPTTFLRKRSNKLTSYSRHLSCRLRARLSRPGEQQQTQHNSADPEVANL
ncbi:hypothetical protein T09_15452 [Trichinella sp. T9]|nr:hypothetical protein T09_15452 [Trichinella sp. T9]